MPLEHEEQALVARLRDGDGHAFAILIERYLNAVTRFAFYTVKSHDGAEDVAQTVFIELWERRATLDPARSIKSYLFRAVRNRALNDRKADAVRARYRTNVQADAVAGTARATVPNPEGTILSVMTVQAAIAALSERRQLALRLRVEEELTHVEIAEVLGLSPENAKRLVSRAIADLRNILRVSL